ncbi:MAG: hypothetical protein DSZ28_07700 [Thiothrix sp.]|nr:MAG: hypothetical protein DSZ28_07700 [Thiothrix sp.]
MTDKSDYSTEEWQLLIDMPMIVGAAIMVAGKSGLGTVKEAFAIARGNITAARAYPDNTLIQAILSARIQDKEKSSIESFSHPMLKLQPNEFKNVVVEKSHEVNALLGDKSNSAEADEYKAWLKTIADKVAHAASEGGILGFGGEQFSESEKMAISEINSALGIA